MIKERFLILAREANSSTQNLQTVLKHLGKVEVILDKPGEGLWYSDEVLGGYTGLTSSASAFPPVSAWARAMYHLSLTFQPDEAVWFVEDDVAGNPQAFEALVKETVGRGSDLAAFEIRSEREDEDWPHWSHARPWFEDAWRSFKPLSRKSARLVKAALDFREINGRFTFHEVLFPSLAKQLGMHCLDWQVELIDKGLIGDFRYRPYLTVPQGGICHPVKDVLVHESICFWTEDSDPAIELLVMQRPSALDEEMLLRRVRIIHPHWIDYVDLFEGGGFRRHGSGCQGTWVEDRNGLLHLGWRDWRGEVFYRHDEGRGDLMGDIPTYTLTEIPYWSMLGKAPKVSPFLFDLGFRNGEGLAQLREEYLIDEKWTIFAFEPNSHCHGKLYQTKGIIPMPFAVADGPGSATFQREAQWEGGPESGEGSHLLDVGLNLDVRGGGTETVWRVDFGNFLSSVIPESRPRSLVVVKMDIEGAEYSLLRSMLERGLMNRLDVLHVEFHHRLLDSENEETTAALIGELRKHVRLILHG